MEAAQAYDHLHILLKHHVRRPILAVPGGHIPEVKHLSGRRVVDGNVKFKLIKENA